MEINLTKYIGRSYESCDCIALVKEFYKDHFNLDLKNYYEGPAPDRAATASLIQTNLGAFFEVHSVDKKLGDLVFIKIRGIESHIGIVIDHLRFLHSAKTVGSNIDRLSRYSKLITGFYRHREIGA